ncbi:hypothetical protein ACFSY7_03075 [Kurthia populi]|uniref:Uncharacterized protein n=1 Tax=Kurthia populi TaxID=1562132 RepID=A0ABW5XWY2_9BACL
MRNYDVKYPSLTMQDLLFHAGFCAKANKELTVLIEMPGFDAPEMITNPPENIQKKIEYYQATYDENCQHKHAPGIRIVDLVR